VGPRGEALAKGELGHQIATMAEKADAGASRLIAEPTEQLRSPIQIGLPSGDRYSPMPEKPIKDRLIFHPSLDIFECDFSAFQFTGVEDVDTFYDEIERRLEVTGRRWYFLVNYVDCVIAPEAWDRFAARGKHTNITFSLGTVRVGASEEVRKEICERARLQMFRSNLFATRDEALFAIAEKRKHHAISKRVAEDFFRVEAIQLLFGGVRALDDVGFSVHRGEIVSIIGPNGAGKTSLLRILSPHRRPNHLRGKGPVAPRTAGRGSSGVCPYLSEYRPVQEDDDARQHHDRASVEAARQLSLRCLLLGPIEAGRNGKPQLRGTDHRFP
jgi:hypothetical protein